MSGNLKRQVDMDGGKGAEQRAPTPAPEQPKVHEKVDPKPVEAPKPAAPAPAKPVEAPKTITPTPKPAAPAPATSTPGVRQDLTAGHVTMWKPDRGFGFVEADGKSYYLPEGVVPKDEAGHPIDMKNKDVEFTFVPAREPGKKPSITSIRIKPKT
ncbi:MAG: hypothetical protein FJY77_05220 [Candidatus Altiarchaeales archaeon]|nr:hypothetical protein [Candidatus Altiarchaeales archaeon]